VRTLDWRIRIGLSLALVLPVLFIAVFSFFKMRNNLTEYTLSRRQTIAQLAAVAIHERFGRLEDIGNSLATRVRFRTLVGKGKWQEAIEIMKDEPMHFPMVDRVFVTDLKGTLRADTPPLRNVRGRNFAHQDWYQGVSRNWQLYISQIYKRAAAPRFNVIAVAVPIKNQQNQAVGILVVQARVERIFDWLKSIDVGPSGYVYVVDKAAAVAGQPSVTPEGEVLSYGAVPVVQKVLRGRHGIEISYNPINRVEELAAFEPVPRYGWGVIVQQPAAVAFELQNKSLRLLMLVYGVIIAISCATTYLVLRLIFQLIQAQAARAEAEKGIALRDDFISVASHELKTPLSALRMQLQLVPRMLANIAFKGRDSFIELIGMALRQLDEFARLVEELLDVSRITAGRLSLSLSNTDLSEVVRTVVERYRADLEEAGCPTTLLLSPSVVGYWDPIRIEQVVVNLLTNAMKYGGGKPIEITARSEGGFALLLVRDYGIGIEKQYQSKIFDRYERAEPVTKYRGLGLGLFITRQIVLAHSGSIHVESEGTGRGSAFIVKLPQL
jgi:signal transduction histidine kinase